MLLLSITDHTAVLQLLLLPITRISGLRFQLPVYLLNCHLQIHSPATRSRIYYTVSQKEQNSKLRQMLTDFQTSFTVTLRRKTAI